MPVRSFKPLTVTEVDTPAGTTPQPLSQVTQPISSQLKDGLSVAAAGLGALGIGTLLLRLTAEAAAVAGAALIIGMHAGSAGISFQSTAFYLFLAVAGGALVGLCVGLVTKRVFWSLVSAPAGALVGSLLAGVLRPSAASPFPWSVLLAAAGAAFFALLGGRRSGSVPLRCLQVVRPLLGLIGGALFGMLGFLITHRIY